MKRLISSILAINMMCAGMPVHANGEVCVGDTCAQRIENQVVKSDSTGSSIKEFYKKCRELDSQFAGPALDILSNLLCGTYPWFCYGPAIIWDCVTDLSKCKDSMIGLCEWGKWCATHPGECWSARNEALENRQDNYAFVHQEDGIAADFLHWLVLGILVYNFIPKWGKTARLKSSVARAMQGLIDKNTAMQGQIDKLTAMQGQIAKNDAFVKSMMTVWKAKYNGKKPGEQKLQAIAKVINDYNKK